MVFNVTLNLLGILLNDKNLTIDHEYGSVEVHFWSKAYGKRYFKHNLLWPPHFIKKMKADHSLYML